MDHRLFLSVFVTIFVAELGDKTQLATMSMAAGASSRWVVFSASALALTASAALAVLGGEAVSRVVPAFWLRRAAGVVFIALGLMYVFTASAKD